MLQGGVPSGSCKLYVGATQCQARCRHEASRGILPVRSSILSDNTLFCNCGERVEMLAFVLGGGP